MKTQMTKFLMIGVALGGLAACGEPGTDNAPDGPSTDDGVVKKMTGADGKSDAWNWRNNPVHFRTELNYNYDDLPLEGYSEVNAWAASYWPYYEDGINYRWQGQQTLSPAEKYDKAFNDWTFDETFMSLKPFNPSTCEFDEAYYENLGPAAEWTHRNKGNWQSSNGIDDDGDGIPDSEECGWGDEDKDRDGVETWWGICHAWAPAAILEEEPVEPVEHNGVKFEVSDIKALLIQQYDRTSAYMLGGRCNEEEIERDENGRIVSEECRDLNAGTFHVIVANFLGVNSRPLVIERTTGYQVWNQPLLGFKVTEEREITVEEANELLGVGNDEGTGEFIHGVEEGSADALGVLELANNATFDELDIDARLDRRAAQGIVDARPFGSLAELDEVSYVAATAFESMLEYAKNTSYWQPAVVEYAYNPNAERFIEIRATTDWLTESHASTEPQAPNTARYTRHDYYHYILELDGEGNILGGEWVGGSHGTHPDFIWLPTRARYGNPNIELDEVRELIRKSRAGVDEEDEDTEARTITASNDDLIAIPDNDPNGVTSIVEVAEEGTVTGVTIDLGIEHTYRGDIIVELRHAGVAMNVYDGSSVDSQWEDDVVLTGEAVEGFLGSAAAGEWELFIYDRWGYDTGSLTGWTLNIDVE